MKIKRLSSTLNEDTNSQSEEVLIRIAQDLYDSSDKDWFDRTDLDEYLYNRSFLDKSETDEPYLKLFPPELLNMIHDNMKISNTLSDSANILKGMKQDGYRITKK